MRIYIAGPYSKGDVAQNVRNAMFAANYLAHIGHTPFIPHLSHFWHLAFPHPYEFWLKQDMVWLLQCDAILRLEGESNGADKEVAEAEKHGITVYRSVFDIPAVETHG